MLILTSTEKSIAMAISQILISGICSKETSLYPVTERSLSNEILGAVSDFSSDSDLNLQSIAMLSTAGQTEIVLCATLVESSDFPAILQNLTLGIKKLIGNGCKYSGTIIIFCTEKEDVSISEIAQKIESNLKDHGIISAQGYFSNSQLVQPSMPIPIRHVFGVTPLQEILHREPTSIDFRIDGSVINLTAVEEAAVKELESMKPANSQDSTKELVDALAVNGFALDPNYENFITAVVFSNGATALCSLILGDGQYVGGFSLHGTPNCLVNRWTSEKPQSFSILVLPDGSHELATIDYVLELEDYSDLAMINSERKQEIIHQIVTGYAATVVEIPNG